MYYIQHILLEPFRATSDGLDELTSKFQAIERDDKNSESLKIDEIFVSDLKDVKKEWLDLGNRGEIVPYLVPQHTLSGPHPNSAREYSEVGWVMPMPARRAF